MTSLIPYFHDGVLISSRRCLVSVIAGLMLAYTSTYTMSGMAQTTELATELGESIRLNSSVPLNDQLGNRITTLSAGQQIEVLGVEGGEAEVVVTQGFPVWVNADYVEVIGDQAEIVADALRARSVPNDDSHLSLLGLIVKGYRSAVLERSNGWLRIQGPPSLSAFIKADALRNASRFLTNGSVEVEAEPINGSLSDNTVAQGVSPSTLSTATIKFVESPISSAVNVSGSYRMAPGDTISVSVFSESELSIAGITIPANGIISFPLIGGVNFAGQTTDQVAKYIGENLSQGYVRDAQVTVSVDNYRPIYVRGAVGSPGAYPFTTGLTIPKVITLAGGATRSAVYNGVKITRYDESVLDQLSLDSQIRVMPGDIISLLEDLSIDADDVRQFIYVHGEVKRPGEFEYRTGLTVEKAIALAGGFSPRASRSKIDISRDLEGSVEPEILRKVPLYESIMPGDVISVRASWF